MDEATAILRARRLCRELTIDQLRLPLTEFVKAIGGLPGNVVVRLDDALDDEESGHTVQVAGKHCVVLNANHTAERQRFTACHEIGHMILEVATEHDQGSGPFARRTQNEFYCDVFAAEIVLPKPLVLPLVEDADIGLNSVERLAVEFGTSLAATGSRFAEFCDRPCAFVLIKQGIIKYAARSRSMKDCGAFVSSGSRAPESSLAHRAGEAPRTSGPVEVEAVDWLKDWKRGGRLLEEVRHFPRWDQTLALLWFEDDRVPDPDQKYADDVDYDELPLRPLDGVLQWPTQRRRR